LSAITVHEAAHAWTADMLGDPTPRLAGRLTLNPIPHIDPIGFLMLIVARIGWAKPVPINPYNFKDPVKGEMLVSIAGPASNFLMAFVVARVFQLVSHYVAVNADVVSIVSDLIFMNIALGVFNLIPIPPLDGSHLLEAFIPNEMKASFEQYGFFMLIFIIFFPPATRLLFQAITFIFRLLV
jgi:Zn-dependent protease